MSTLNFLELTLHKTTPQYRAGLLQIFVHVKEIIHSQIPASDLIKSLTKHVHGLESEVPSEQFQLGLYAGVGWIRHVLQSIEILDTIHVHELLEHIQKIVCEIDKLST